MAIKRPCIIDGCTTSTVYEDGKCRTHRRIQKTVVGSPTTRVRLDQVAESLNGTEKSQQWANQFIKYGQHVIRMRPTVREFSDRWMISNWDFAPYDTANQDTPDSYLVDDATTSTKSLVVSKTTTSREAVERLSYDQYRNHIFPKTGGSSSSVEQYDDAAEAIAALNIGARYGDTRIAYMIKPSTESVRLTSTTDKGEKFNIVADIIPGEFEANSEGVCGRSYMGTVKSVTFDGKEIDKINIPNQAANLIQEICNTRASIARYSFQDQGHEGTNGFFIPAGWTGA